MESISSERPRGIPSRLDRVEEQLAVLQHDMSGRLERVLEALELLIDDEPRARRRLAELRRSSDYELAYTERDPLVSVVIPTYDRLTTLTDRAIPSILAQTYANVEVVVVGDAAAPDLEQAVAALDDPRVRFHNLSVRGPYDADPVRAWSQSGTPPMNAGLALARGRWLTCIGDDDTIAPDHVAKLLAFARAERLEFAYGRFRYIVPDGAPQMVGEFPPRFGEAGLQISLWHGGLRFFQFELAHALFGVPNDWGLIRRMLRSGVRMGQTMEVLVPYTPSGRHAGFGEDSADEGLELRRRISELGDRIDEVEAERDELAKRLHALHEASSATALQFDRRLREVLNSRSWRMTAPLRSAMDLRRRVRGAGR